MTRASQLVREQFEVRKTKQQKQAFRDWLCRTLEREGFAVQVERHKGIFTSHNVVVGDPERAKLLLTAHYDTCAVLPFPNFLTPRNLLWYLLYQLLLLALFFAAIFVASFLVTTLLVFVAPDASWAVAASILISYALLVFCLWWLFDGKANRHTANDNTSGVVLLLETALSLPHELRQQVCFVFFDNEERGMLGAMAFGRAHKQVREQTPALNFDCVGDGDSIQFFPVRRARKTDLPQLLEQAFEGNSKKTVEVVRGFAFYPSDQVAFHRGVGVCALKRSKVFGYYMDRIHTKRDTVLDEGNLRLLRRGIPKLIRILPEKESAHAE